MIECMFDCMFECIIIFSNTLYHIFSRSELCCAVKTVGSGAAAMRGCELQT